MDINIDVLKILINCGCVQYAMKFAGLTMEKLFLYTRDDLSRILSSSRSQDLVQKIEEEIEKAKSQKVEQQIGQNEDDDDLKILDVIIRTDGTQMTIKEEIIDDDDGGQQNNDHLASMDEQVNLNNDDGGGPNPAPDDDSSEDVNYKTKKPIELNPRTPKKGFQKLKADERAAVIIAGGQQHKCEKDHPTNSILKAWTTSLSRFGSHIRSLTMSTWTWKEPTSSCPWNLYKILTQQCPFINELAIEGNINNSSDDDEVPQFPPNFRLPNLKILRIHHNGDLAYTRQLEQILVAANKIRQIYFSYGSLEAVNSFLTILQDLPKDQLKSLKILSIKSLIGSGYLTEAQIVILGKVEAVSLEELELGDGLWDDVQGSTMENMLRRFSSTLQKLTVLGGFQGRSELKPKILITFPCMVNLKHLDIGSNYTYDAVFEDSLPLPPPKKIQKGSNGQRINATNSDLKSEPLPVSLQFPLLPNLKDLRLGHLFNIKDLHFSSFPKLETFFVGSRWDVSVIFPPEKTSRRASYPLVADLKLPDCLDDPNFIKFIPSRFPNVEFCWIILPTNKVMRTFFSVMADSKLKELKLSTRFDFPCTLDTCLQDKPSEVPLVLAEVEKIRLLKEYGHWEEFIKFHSIQLPEDNLSSLEGEGLAGLSSLKNLTTLTLSHRPRTLRIPKGQLHWTDPQCEFTGQFIGFREYPWSLSCETLRNDLMTKSLKKDFYLNYKVPFRTVNKPELMENAFYVQPSLLLTQVKDEETQENV